jgi:hypothetical protein
LNKEGGVAVCKKGRSAMALGREGRGGEGEGRRSSGGGGVMIARAGISHTNETEKDRSFLGIVERGSG